MKSFLSMAALCCAAALVGCNNNKTNDASPGAMPECKCPEGCMKEGKCSEGCTAACCQTKASPGAVSEKKEGCCSEAAKNGASMGAVSEKKDGCCSGAAKTTEGASLGAVSEKSGTCTKTCPVTGKTLN